MFAIWFWNPSHEMKQMAKNMIWFYVLKQCLGFAIFSWANAVAIAGLFTPTSSGSVAGMEYSIKHVMLLGCCHHTTVWCPLEKFNNFIKSEEIYWEPRSTLNLAHIIIPLTKQQKPLYNRQAQFFGENLDKLHSEIWAKTWLDTKFWAPCYHILPRHENTKIGNAQGRGSRGSRLDLEMA